MPKMLRLPKPKLSDVAARAKVSIATVSRALSNPEMVRPQTRERITQVISELGYVPDAAARALASRRTRTVGAIVPTLDHAIFGRAIQAMQITLAEAGYQLLIASHEYSLAVETSAAKALLEQGVDALLLVGTDHSREVWSMIEDAPIPIVFTWSLHSHVDCIGFDNEAAGRLAAAHLLSLGHRRFGVISGHIRNNDRAASRLEGIRKALGEVGLHLPAASIVEHSFGYSGGRAGMAALLALAAPPTAVIGGNDLMAIGAMIELQARGLHVPRDVSIAGIDDLDLAAHTAPGLTTVHLPTSQLGRRAAEHVLRRLEGHETERIVEMPIELVVRGSTGPVSAPVKLSRGGVDVESD